MFTRVQDRPWQEFLQLGGGLQGLSLGVNSSAIQAAPARAADDRYGLWDDCDFHVHSFDSEN
jgi:hypothetical protein